MTIKEKDLEEMIIEACDSWLTDHDLMIMIDQSTDVGASVNDVWNDWYNDDVLLPVNEAVDEALTNGGYDELDYGDIDDICNSIFDHEELINKLLRRCYDTGFDAGFKAAETE